MKTPMHQLSEWVVSIRKSNTHDSKHDLINKILKRIDSHFLACEKKQIIDAYWAGLNGCINDYSESKTVGSELIGIKIGGGAENYFSKHYKPKINENNDGWDQVMMIEPDPQKWINLYNKYNDTKQ